MGEGRAVFVYVQVTGVPVGRAPLAAAGCSGVALPAVIHMSIVICPTARISPLVVVPARIAGRSAASSAAHAAARVVTAVETASDIRLYVRVLALFSQPLVVLESALVELRVLL